MLLVFLPLCPKGHLPYSRGEAPSGGFSTDFLHTDKLHGSCSPKVGELRGTGEGYEENSVTHPERHRDINNQKTLLLWQWKQQNTAF